MHPAEDNAYAVAYGAALQVVAVNGVRGLLAAEKELNPLVAGICVVLTDDGEFTVTATDAAGRPVGGYAA